MKFHNEVGNCSLWIFFFSQGWEENILEYLSLHLWKKLKFSIVCICWFYYSGWPIDEDSLVDTLKVESDSIIHWRIRVSSHTIPVHAYSTSTFVRFQLTVYLDRGYTSQLPPLDVHPCTMIYNVCFVANCSPTAVFSARRKLPKRIRARFLFTAVCIMEFRSPCGVCNASYNL